MIQISTDKKLLDVPYIQSVLTELYWAKGRSLQEVQVTIDNSRCYGLYLHGRQIGFARIVTDYAVFAYLMDVFIDENYRGGGYSSMLMEKVFNDPELSGVRIWRLATTDAFFLYEKFGFKRLEHPDRLMEKFT
jgi:GNAT superfamily N-acetyltransferase